MRVRVMGVWLQPPPAADTAPTVRYPDNINLSDLAYFMAAPTLCYQVPP